MKRFMVTLQAEIAVDEKLIDAVLTDEWRRQFYNLRTPEAVAEHLAFNLLHGRKMASLDGFADRKETDAVILSFETIDADPILPPPPKKASRGRK